MRYDKSATAPTNARGVPDIVIKSARRISIRSEIASVGAGIGPPIVVATARG